MQTKFNQKCILLCENWCVSHNNYHDKFANSTSRCKTSLNIYLIVLFWFKMYFVCL